MKLLRGPGGRLGQPEKQEEPPGQAAFTCRQVSSLRVTSLDTSTPGGGLQSAASSRKVSIHQSSRTLPPAPRHPKPVAAVFLEETPACLHQTQRRGPTAPGNTQTGPPKAGLTASQIGGRGGEGRGGVFSKQELNVCHFCYLIVTQEGR